MTSRFVRASKFRHVYGTAAKRENCYDNIRVSNNAWDTNIVKVNPLFISVNWNPAGGGAFVVIPHSQVGKLRDNFPIFRGHSAAVLDTDFSPFNDYLVASASEDCKVMIWTVPEVYDDDLEFVEPVSKLNAHGRKVGHIMFHPLAENVLLTASTDLTVKLWDIEKGAEKQEIKGHTDGIQSLSWNYTGNLVVTTCRDKKLRIIDVRANKVVQETAGHQGVKGSRVVWLGDADRLATTGFSKMSDRQLFLWDTNNLSKPLKQNMLDTSSGVVMPFYDPDVKMLYLAGKGDGNIRYYELENDELYLLSEFQSSTPQRGMDFLPKRAVNVAECEIARAYKVGHSDITPISFTVPRKSDAFQSDLFPPTIGDEPVLTADEWFGGKSAKPKIIDLEAGFTVKKKKNFVAAAPAAEEKTEKAPKNEKEYQEAYHELRRVNEDLKNAVSQRDTRILVLEIELEKLKGKMGDLKISEPLQSPSSAAKEVIGSTNSETLEDGPVEVTSGNSTAEFIENVDC